MMMRYLLVVLLALFSTQIWAEEDLSEKIALSKAPIDRTDMESIKRGAKIFSTTCITCHTLVYLRYDKVAQEAGITYEKMPVNVKTWPNGIVPPDLSLEADVRGVDWIYTYLHSFYKDSTRPTGYNNLLVHNSGMMDMVAPMQGDQEFVEHPMSDLLGQYEWYDLVKLTRQGSMSPEEFDKSMADLVNFLAYAAEPYHQEQTRIGYGVLGFLIVLFVLMYYLKREYWKDVKKHRKE